MGEIILAADHWRTNGALIADVAVLHLRSDWLWLDATYGRGMWWTKWCPEGLVFNDKYTQDGFDFRDLPFDDCLFDAVAYDPPYVVMGKRTAANKGDRGAKDVGDRFGVAPDDMKKEDLQALINAGLTEIYRITRCSGIVLVKCQDYISNRGGYWAGSHHTLTHALSLGFKLVDRFEMVSGLRAQPPGLTQRHARRNLSTLFVLKKAAA